MEDIGYIYILHNQCFDEGEQEVYKFGYTYDIKRRKYDTAYTTAFVKECYYKTHIIDVIWNTKKIYVKLRLW
jgi:hypothetical protein